MEKIDKDIYVVNKECDSIAVHYNMQNNSCVMNATIESESTVTFLQAVNYVSRHVGLKVNVETSSLQKGSVVRCFRFVIEEQDKNYWLLYIFMTLFKYVFFQNNGEFDLKINTFSKEEQKQLQDVLKEKRLTDEKIKKISSDYVVIRQRSDFFKRIAKRKDILGISIETGENFDFKYCDNLKQISAKEFNDFIVELLPEEIIVENACIYILSPVILKGQKVKWKGVYENRVITFELKSNEFKTMAQNGLGFRSGSNIICTLKYKKRIDRSGNEHFSDYQVILVLKYGVDDNYEETIEGKKKRIEDNSPTLFDGLEY